MATVMRGQHLLQMLAEEQHDVAVQVAFERQILKPFFSLDRL
jgi:hypothetical protein